MLNTTEKILQGMTECLFILMIDFLSFTFFSRNMDLGLSATEEDERIVGWVFSCDLLVKSAHD